jgi:hypothetical protein
MAGSADYDLKKLLIGATSGPLARTLPVLPGMLPVPETTWEVSSNAA